MRNGRSPLIGILICLVSLVVLSPSSHAAPPPLDIPPGALAALNAHIPQIDERLKYWGEQIVKATTPSEITEARDGALNDYRLYTSTDYQYTFAQRAAEVLSPFLNGSLKKDDKLLPLKEVNLALALSRMPQVTIQPALDVMVVHRNPGVRYLGYDGYRAVRTLILGQLPDYVTRMFDALKAAAAKEDSAPAVGAIFQLVNFSEFTTGSVSGFVIRDAQAQGFEILQANWARWCDRVLRGNAEITRAFTKGVQSVKTLAPTVATDRAGKAKVLQLLVDLGRCSSIAYDEVQNKKGLIALENKVLLRDCESILSEVSGKRLDYVTKPLTDEDVADRGAGVKTAILKWVEDLSEFGVVKPKFESPTVRPASPVEAPSAP